MKLKLKNKHLIIILGLMIGLVGCSGFEGILPINGGSGGAFYFANPYGTCDRKDVATMNICSEAVGSEYNDSGYLAILQSSCQSTGGVYSTNNCERTTSLGTCIIGSGQSNETHVTYYEPEYDLASAQSACNAMPGGSFFAQ